MRRMLRASDGYRGPRSWEKCEEEIVHLDAAVRLVGYLRKEGVYLPGIMATRAAGWFSPSLTDRLRTYEA